AIGAHQEDRFDQIAARLLDGKCCKTTVVARAFGHHAVDRQPKLLVDLLQREFRQVAVAAALLAQKFEGISDGRFAALDWDVHDQPPGAMAGGSASNCEPAAKTMSTPQGKSA